MSISNASLESAKTRDELIDILRTEVPGARVIAEPNDERIVHLAEATVEQKNDYPLNRKASIRFSGSPSELLSSVSADTHGAVAMPTMISANESVFDFVTQVTTDARDATYRSILSQLPLEKYNWILWTAVTQTLDGKQQTWVKFMGPRPD
jgi:hypothetical protein